MTHWVTGYGTGGTFHGAGKALKEALPDIQIVLAEPEAAGLLASGVKTWARNKIFNRTSTCS